MLTGHYLRNSLHSAVLQRRTGKVSPLVMKCRFSLLQGHFGPTDLGGDHLVHILLLKSLGRTVKIHTLISMRNFSFYFPVSLFAILKDQIIFIFKKTFRNIGNNAQHPMLNIRGKTLMGRVCVIN